MEVEEATFDVFSTSRSRLLLVDDRNASLFNSHSLGMLQWGSLEDFKAFNKKWESVDDVRQIPSDFSAPASHLGSADRLQLLGMDHTVMGNVHHHETYSQSGTLPLGSLDDVDEVVFEIMVDMRPGEKRFGFSVMGGLDEGFPPRIDDIASGSPADRADLEVWDEILEVNGRSLENCTHAEVITFIHKCIRSRCIKLRVRRRKNNKSGGPSFENVQDAYMIAVEDAAKEKLEKLSQTHTIVPLDMTKLALSNQNTASEESQVESYQFNQSSMPVNTKGKPLGNGHLQQVEMNGFSEKEMTKKSKGDKGRKDSKAKRNSTTETPLIENARSQNSLNHSQEELQYYHEQEDSFNYPYTENSFEVDDPGPHREMAIDCPDSFTATVKSHPRPPSSHSPYSHPSTPNKSIEKLPDGKSQPEVISNGQQNVPVTQEQLERLRKHQEDLRKRREEESRIAREQEFLRTSLRGSKKLQALESRGHNVEGMVNTAFEENDDEMDNLDDGFGSTRASEKDRYMKKNLGTKDIFTCLKKLQSKLNAAEERDELSFLTTLFQSPQFQQAVNIHRKMISVTTQSPPPKPEATDAYQTSNEVMEELQNAQSPYSSDLLEMLSSPGFRNLFRAHDLVAAQQLKPVTSLPDEAFEQYSMQTYGEDSIKIVQLQKTNEPLGATVRNDGDAVIIGRIVKGGTAEKSGRLHEGDEILEVNGIDMRGKNINDVSDLLANMSGNINFTIIPAGNFTPKLSPREQEEMIHVKALFNYDPEEDIYIPCRELGISFMKGDILHVISTEDSNWWQAYREGEQEHQSLAGLIPSRSFQEQKERNKIMLENETKESKKKSQTCSCGRRDKKRKRKSLYETEEILTYEEVEMYYPQPNRKRPIVLIGPPNVGRHELRSRLMESDFDRFAAAVPHTSRPPKSDEGNGKDYHFVTRAEFEADIVSNKFVEHGEHEKNLYGTSLDAVRQVINTGKICILNLHPESLQVLKSSDLKPYIVFVYPPNMEKLRQMQRNFYPENNISDDMLKDIIERAREMEEKYGHFFDYILVNQDMDRAYSELLGEINRLEVEPQWVPLQWVDS
ncbi:protein PALS1-like isoform X1 [Saccostrea echinata]|uniref:protein PALS1-like isoform X1 n=1 Tax=Saccostrea echinata TaxID=191078 RepID=UPI002A7F49E6|nr:protein PALS1-like isoform X1 [Saccostrea echinata]